MLLYGYKTLKILALILIMKFRIIKLFFKVQVYLLLVACTFSSSLQSTLNSETSQAQSLVNSGEVAPAETACDSAPSSNNGPL